MSRIKLLTRAAVSAGANFESKQCVRAISSAPTVVLSSTTTNIYTNCSNNYLISRHNSHYAGSHWRTTQLVSSTRPFGRYCDELHQKLSAPHPVLGFSTSVGSCYFGTKTHPDRAGKSDTKASAAVAQADIFGDSSKLGIFAKFKLMYKQYWYVLIPVHVVTSIGWLGAFYYMSKSGVDIPSLLQYIHLSDTILEKVQQSGMGHYAIAFLCYKIASPLRYAVTLGGTTVAIKYLVQMGHIKPMPTKHQIMQMYEKKKADRAAAKAEKENQ